MEMFTVMRRNEVAAILKAAFQDFTLDEERIPIEKALGRILSEDLISQENIPAFRRSTVDGYGLRAKDTVGCSDTLPAFLSMIGETRMGLGTDLKVGAEQAVYVPTGGIVPEGADAVCMIEYAESFGDEIAIQKPMSQLENIVNIGDDVGLGERILEKGTRIGTQHVGAIAALGLAEIPVFRRLRVAIISTGDELVAPGTALKLGQIRDSNTDTLRAMVQSIGGEVVLLDRIVDQFAMIQSTMEKALAISDVVLISGGSSVGNHDMTPEIINSLGTPGIMVHGIAIKPGKPTMVAKVQGKAVFGLPGHPASCFMAYKAVVEPFLMKELQGFSNQVYPIEAIADFQIHVSSGRDVFYMVTVRETDEGLKASPIHGKSGMVSLLSKADGYIEIPMEKEGLEKGEKILVHRF